MSQDARELVQEILTPDPQQRPTLHEIVDHSFFIEGIVPGFIPTTAHDSIPSFRHISRAVSQANLAGLRQKSLLDEDQVTSIAVPTAPQSTTTSGGNSASVGTTKLKNSMTSSIAQQEKEFQKAVQPGSPISALLSSARQPLLMSSNGTRESPLLRKLQAAAPANKSPGRAARARGLQNIAEEDDIAAARGPRVRAEDESRKKELEAQKARIVAQMAPPSAVAPAFGKDELENLPPIRKEVKGKERAKDVAREEAAPAVVPALKLNGFDAAGATLTAAFEAKAHGKLFRDPREDVNIPDERVFIVSWVDYCNKYGMGYALTDGSVGVHFNDSTTLVLSADKK